MEDGHVSEAGLDDNMIDTQLQNISCYVTDLELEVSKILEGANETVLTA